MQFVVDDVLVARDFQLLYVLAIGFALLTIINVVTTYIRSWIILYLGNTLNIQLVANLARHLLRLPLDFFEKRHMGDVVSRFGSMSAIQNKISTDFIESIVDASWLLLL